MYANCTNTSSAHQRHSVCCRRPKVNAERQPLPPISPSGTKRNQPSARRQSLRPPHHSCKALRHPAASATISPRSRRISNPDTSVAVLPGAMRTPIARTGLTAPPARVPSTSPSQQLADNTPDSPRIHAAIPKDSLKTHS